MRLITRHILGALTAPFLWGVVALTGLLLLNQLAPLIDRFGGKGLGADVIIEAVVLALPALMVLTIPMSVLVATLYAYSTLSADLELVAMYANGISVWRMVRPAMLAVIGISLLNFVIFDQIVPLSNSRYKTLQMAVANATPTLSLRAEELNELGASGYVLRAHEIHQENGKLVDVTIHDLLSLEGRSTIHADSGRMARSPSGSDLLLTLYDGAAYTYSSVEPTRVERTAFKVDVVRMTDVEKEFKRAMGLAERGDREKSGCELQDGITEADWRHRRAKDQLELLTQRDLRSLAGLEPLPPPAAAAMPTFPTHCTGVRGRVQRLLERVLLPTPLAAQQPVRTRPRPAPPPTQDSVRPHGVTPPVGQRPVQFRPDSPFDRSIAADSDSVAGAPTDFIVPPGGPLSQRVDGLVSSIGEVLGTRITAHGALRTEREYAVEYHKKFAIRLASFCFVLVGIALALKLPQGGIGLVIGGSLIIFLGFYVLLIGGENLANDGVISAQLAMYGPVVALTLAGLIAVAAANRAMGSARGSGFTEWFRRLLPRRRPSPR